MAIRLREAIAPTAFLRPLGRLARQGGSSLVDLIFPPHCAYCDAELVDRSSGIGLCPACAEAISPPQWCGCVKCGAWLGEHSPPTGPCPVCRGLRLQFDTVLPLGRYDGELRSAVLAMKEVRGEVLAGAVGRLLARRRGPSVAAERPDLVVPVPMHWRRRFLRGVNSPDVLADHLSRHLGVPSEPSLLVRWRDTPPQTDLSPGQRVKNVRGAFRVRKGYNIRGTRVVLVDDVLTTGATCSEAARMLKNAGAARVVVAVAARTPHPQGRQ